MAALMLWLKGKSAILKFAMFEGMPCKHNQCHTTLGGLSSVCAKLEPSSSKTNEILEINVLQKLTPHTLFNIQSSKIFMI